MASKARQSFDRNAADIERLLQIHQNLGGDTRGRRYRLEVLNKAAIVLITSFWEAYCEDLAAEALEHVVKHAKSSAALSNDIKKLVARELKSESNELAVWELTDSGWRKLLRDRLARLQDQRNRRLNTPRAANIDELLLSAIGIPDVSQSWTWHKMTAEAARVKLDKYVTLRGAIAHRGAATGSCTKAQVEDYFKLIKRVVGKTGGRVNAHVRKATGKPLWVRRKRDV
jgi:hypothetical protein